MDIVPMEVAYCSWVGVTPKRNVLAPRQALPLRNHLYPLASTFSSGTNKANPEGLPRASRKALSEMYLLVPAGSF